MNPSVRKTCIRWSQGFLRYALDLRQELRLFAMLRGSAGAGERAVVVSAAEIFLFTLMDCVRQNYRDGLNKLRPRRQNYRDKW